MKLRTNPIDTHMLNFQKMYFLLGIIFLIGICGGAFVAVAIHQDVCQQAKASLNESIKGINNSGNNVLISSFFSTVKPVFLIWLSGLWGYGAWFIMIILGIKGITTGFSVALMIRLYDIKGVALSAAGVLPQHLIIIPLLLYMCNCGIEQTQIPFQTLLISKNRYLAIKYLVVLLIGLIVALLAASVDGYVTSNILKGLAYMLS